MKHATIQKILLAGVVLAVLPACSILKMDTETDIVRKRVELYEQPYSVALPAVIDDAALWQAREDYRRYGTGSVRVISTYDPASKGSTAMTAANAATVVSAHLRKLGVPVVQPEIMATTGQPARVLLGYDTIKARAPEGCEPLGGQDGTDTGANMEYEYGCAVESLLARQIARPQDLEGRGSLDSGDGRRQSNIVERNRTGVENTPLTGQSASGE